MFLEYGIRNIRHHLLANKKIASNSPRITPLFRWQIVFYSTHPNGMETSQLFPIPKPTDWEFNLEKTWPIILLECLRKLTVRVINTRLARLCLEHNILRGPNFGGLPGGHTKTPIHVLHNVMEDAKNNKKAL